MMLYSRRSSQHLDETVSDDRIVQRNAMTACHSPY